MEKELIKSEIKRSYGAIAENNDSAASCCSNKGCCGTADSTNMAVDYSNVAGYNPDADLALGCGIPTEIAAIEEGDTVIDLGSGAGNDVFVARSIVGETGKVIGLDMTPEMVIRALKNNHKLGYENVDFVLGEIEDMAPIQDNTADVIISNCVMNLVGNKEKAFQEVYRTLKPGGHFSISDIVYQGNLPEGIMEAAEMYAGCVAGASEKFSYLSIIKSTGFKNIEIKKERKIELSDEVLLQYVNQEALDTFRASGSGIYSVTVYAEKLDDGPCCEASDDGCCGTSYNTNNTVKSPASCC